MIRVYNNPLGRGSRHLGLVRWPFQGVKTRLLSKSRPARATQPRTPMSGCGFLRRIARWAAAQTTKW